jgi:hypothetical protein
VNMQFGVDNGHSVAARKLKAAERKLKALFAPLRRPRPLAGAEAHGLDRHRLRGGADFKGDSTPFKGGVQALSQFSLKAI